MRWIPMFLVTVFGRLRPARGYHISVTTNENTVALGVVPPETEEKTAVRVNAPASLNVATVVDGRMTIVVINSLLVTYEVKTTTVGRVVMNIVQTRSHVKVTINLPQGAAWHLCGGKSPALVSVEDVRQIARQMGWFPRERAEFSDLVHEEGYIHASELEMIALNLGWAPPSSSSPFDIEGEPSAAEYNEALAAFTAALATGEDESPQAADAVEMGAAAPMEQAVGGDGSYDPAHFASEVDPLAGELIQEAAAGSGEPVGSGATG